MKCQNCGYTSDEIETFCPICGARVEPSKENKNEPKSSSVSKTGSVSQVEAEPSGFSINESKEKNGVKFDANEPDRNNTPIVCPSCGYQSDEIITFCPVCGSTMTGGNQNQSVPFPNVSSQNTLNQEFNTKTSKTNKPSGDKREDRSQKSRSRKSRIIILIVVLIIIVVCVVVAYFLLGNRQGRRVTGEEQVNFEEESVVGTIESPEQTEAENVVPNASYIGYWNISENEDEELTISNVTEDTVEFTLFVRGVFNLDNTVAYIDENNYASFAGSDGEMMMTGDLIFYDDYIVVNINQADMDYIDTGSMVFSERHLTSWYSSGNDSSESYTNTSPYNSYSNTNSNDSYYILPESSSRLLTYADIQYLTKDELRLARNEIYARHGRRFDDANLQAYFDSQPWYFGTIEPEDFSQDMLSSIERTNVAFIKSYEQ